MRNIFFKLIFIIVGVICLHDISQLYANYHKLCTNSATKFTNNNQTNTTSNNLVVALINENEIEEDEHEEKVSFNRFHFFKKQTCYTFLALPNYNALLTPFCIAAQASFACTKYRLLCLHAVVLLV